MGRRALAGLTLRNHRKPGSSPIVSPFRLRALSPLLLSACVVWAGAPSANAALLAIHDGGHDHRASVVSEGGHLHLVLAHHGAEGAPHRHEPLGEHEASFTDGDHVLHLESDAQLRTTTRRADPAPPLALGHALAVLSPRDRTFALRTPPPPDPLDHRRLRTSVLRL